MVNARQQGGGGAVGTGGRNELTGGALRPRWRHAHKHEAQQRPSALESSRRGRCCRVGEQEAGCYFPDLCVALGPVLRSNRCVAIGHAPLLLAQASVATPNHSLLPSHPFAPALQPESVLRRSDLRVAALKPTRTSVSQRSNPTPTSVLQRSRLGIAAPQPPCCARPFVFYSCVVQQSWSGSQQTRTSVVLSTSSCMEPVELTWSKLTTDGAGTHGPAFRGLSSESVPVSPFKFTGPCRSTRPRLAGSIGPVRTRTQ